MLEPCSFYLVPAAMIVKRGENIVGRSIVRAFEMTPMESDQMLQIPNGIQCKEMNARMGDKVNLKFFF